MTAAPTESSTARRNVPFKSQAWLLNSYQKQTLAFVVRVWIEPREIETDTVIWRGVIETVASPSVDAERPGNLPARRAFSRLDEMIDFMIRHLERIGIPAECLYQKTGTPEGQAVKGRR